MNVVFRFASRIIVMVGGRILVEGEYGGRESSGEYRYTTVWVITQGRWRMLANQITLIGQ